MRISVDGELVKETNLEGFITFIDGFQLKDQKEISVQLGNCEIVIVILNKKAFLQDKERFLLEVIKEENAQERKREAINSFFESF
jgi:hypothetical protein